MIAISIVLNLAGLGVFCWLLFTLAVYALPFFVGITAGLFAYHSGAGSLGAITLALLTGGATLAAGQIAFTLVRTPFLRFVLALLFAAPAALAGFCATHGLAALTMPSQMWQNIFAVIGTIVIGATAWLRLADAPFDDGTSRADRDVDRRRSLTLT
jgi:4-amino-4-deoxy-L-arabinose transferase-like glycosyltransferase